VPVVINHIAKEINLKILVLSKHGTRPRDFAQYVHQLVGPATRTDLKPVPRTVSLAGAQQMFSFLPEGLGQIRGFTVRVHVIAVSGPTTPAELDAAMLGATTILLTATSDPNDYRALVDHVTASPLYSNATPILLLAEETNGGPPVEKPAAVAFALRTTPGNDTDYFPILKEAVRRSLDTLKQPSPPNTEPVRPVAIVPLVDLLRELEKTMGHPLTEAEVLNVRDTAAFIALTAARAADLAKRRGYPDLDPDHVWREWQLDRTVRRASND
jgi:hypothetical protein